MRPNEFKLRQLRAASRPSVPEEYQKLIAQMAKEGTRHKIIKTMFGVNYDEIKLFMRLWS